VAIRKESVYRHGTRDSAKAKGPMANTTRHDAWQAGDSYDQYMGRWSRQVAPNFLEWLDVPPGLEWLEVGCGTGALTAAVVAGCEPKSMVSIDPSAGFLANARVNVPDARVDFRVGDAQALPVEERSKDVIVSGLVLNFVADRPKALAEMKRVARTGATIGFYVWDYPGGGVEFMSAFWNAATTLDPNASDLTEDRRFPFCTPDGLRDLANRVGLISVDVTAIETPSVFKDFGDFWHPFTLGAGPAPGYCASLSPTAREQLKAKLSEMLPRQEDGSIHLRTRAWAIKTRAA
jgi:SAM-dependent methyltransferase